MDSRNAVIIGCGAIAPVHINAVLNCKYAVLYGVCDTKKERAEAFAEKYGCKAYTDFSQVINDKNVDSVHICTPHYLHGEMLVAAAEAGKMIVVEKPMVMDIKELPKAAKAAEKANICSVIQNRYNNCIVKLKEIIENKTYGKLCGIKGVITWHRTPEYYSESGWRGKWATEGGGLIINQCLHTLDLLCYLGGTPKAIKASADTRILGDVIEVEDTAEATLFLENGILAHFYGTNNYSANSSYDIEADFGDVQVRYIFSGLYLITKDGVTLIEQDEELKSEKAYWGISHKTLINNFYTNMATNIGSYTGFWDALCSVNLVSSFYKSVKSHEKVEIPPEMLTKNYWLQ